jgi:hypothetical protein
MLRVFANIIIIFMSIWALAAALTAMLGLTVYFPWVMGPSAEIPLHRLAAIRVGVLLTCAYFGFLHIFGKRMRLYPINFSTTFLFFLVVGGSVVFYKYQVPLSEYWLSAFFGFVCLMSYVASRPYVRDYLKKRS